MNVPTYCTFRDFKDYYLDDYRDLKETPNITLSKYYINLAGKYREIFNDIPFGKTEEQAQINFIERTFSKKWLHNFFLQKLIKGLVVTNENAYSITYGIADELYNIFKFLDDEILKLPEPIQSNKNRLLYSKEIELNASAFFRGKIETVELLKYLSENFYSKHQKTNDLTKYNQIFAYFNSYSDEIDKSKGNLDKGAYKTLIKELFGFDYGKSGIKGETQKHLEQLENLTNQFYKNQK